MEVVVGSYEEILLGYRLLKIGGEYQLEQSFTDHSHTGCIKGVATSKKGVLASGGNDEIIHLFNLKKRKHLGSLSRHSGSITWIEFYKNSHMFSCSEDGTLCIWKSFTWECLKTLKGHHGAINCVSVHPSGKLALTIGQDKALRTWNLVTGKCAYITNIKKVADMVYWSPTGEFYVVVSYKSVDVYKLETAAVHSSWTTDRRINSVVFISNSVVAYGGEEGFVVFHNIIDNKVIGNLDTETNRIRGMTICDRLTEDKEGEDNSYLVTASSDGYIKVFQINVDSDKETVSTELLASHNTEFRLTCLTALSPKSATESADPNVSIKDTVSTEPTPEKAKVKKIQKNETMDSDASDDTEGKLNVKEELEGANDKSVKKLKQKLQKKKLKRLNGKKKVDESGNKTKKSAVSSTEKKKKGKFKKKT